MQVSIIIPTLNEEKTIGSLLTRLHQNSEENIHQIVVADGGSTDRTREMAKDLGAEVIECGKKGRGFQMNRGAARATGDILYFLHSDTIPPRYFDRLIITSVEQGIEAGCFRLKFDDPHPLLHLYGWMTRFDVNIFRFGDQSLFVNRKIFKIAGRFRENLIVMEDQEIVRRLKRKCGFAILKENVTTSARKYRENGVVRLQLIFGLILLSYYIGIRQDTLVRIYKSLIRS